MPARRNVFHHLLLLLAGVLAFALPASSSATSVSALGGGCDVRDGGSVSCGPTFPDGARGTGVRQAKLSEAVTDGRTIVRGLTDAQRVVGDGDARCALRVSGAVSCWGQNLYRGILSYTGRSEVTTPAAVPGVQGSIDLEVGGGNACVVGAGGAVRCWGDDSYGQTSGQAATGGTPPDLRYVDEPVTVTGIPAARDIALGGLLSCIAAENGTAWCWGYNGAGGFGTGAQHDIDSRSQPLQVPGITGATAIAARGSKVCVLRGGDVWCWGRFAWREPALTSQEIVDRDYATPKKIAGVSNAVQLAVGSSSACARTTSGTVACWGDNSRGQLGALARRSAGALQVRGLSDATDLSIEDEGPCALRAGGAVVCWGVDASVRALDPADRVTQTGAAVTARGISNAVDLGVGSNHWCALLATGEARCAGFDMTGPREETLGTDGSGAAPVASPFVGTAQQLTTGTGHTCFRVADQVRCVGLGHTLDEPVETWNTGGAGALTGVTQIAGGRAHVCARTTSSKVWCWGEQTSGQILYTPRPGMLSAAAERPTSGVVEISATGDRNCARLVAGDVICWGAASGPDGTDSNADTLVALPAPATGLTIVDGQTCATFATAPTTCWGPHSAPIQRIAQCQLVSGSVQCSGDGASGMLGAGSEQFTRWRSVPVSQQLDAILVPLPPLEESGKPGDPAPTSPPTDPPTTPKSPLPPATTPPANQAASLLSASARRSGRVVTVRVLLSPGSQPCSGPVKIAMKTSRGSVSKRSMLAPTAKGCGFTLGLRLPRGVRGTPKVSWTAAGLSGSVRPRS